MDALRGAISGLPDRPGSLNQLKKLGDAIRDDDAVAYGDLHYNKVWSWCNDLVAAAVRDISDLNLAELLGEVEQVSITGRAKIRTTVREKLLRRRSDRLPSIQDLAGVRVEADMTLTEQDRFVEAIRIRFGQSPAAVHDLREGDHSGYRAVHLWVRLDQPRGAWFEVQVRTKLQGAWANLYEALADVAGRGIRYGELPSDEAMRAGIQSTQQLSTRAITALEYLFDAGHRVAAGGLRDDVGLAKALVVIGVDEKDAARQASMVLHEGGPSFVVRRDDAVNQLTRELRAMEARVRSLSERKGG